MNSPSAFSERLRRAFEPTGRGVVGLVDDLLDLCREQGIQLDWQAGRCRVHPLGAGAQDGIEIPLPKSVFRAILARMAALCNEGSPDPVSPYAGEGEFSVGTDPPMAFHVSFTNTPGEQRLEIRPPGGREDRATDGHAFGESIGVPGPRARSDRIGTR